MTPSEGPLFSYRNNTSTKFSSSSSTSSSLPVWSADRSFITSAPLLRPQYTYLNKRNSSPVFWHTRSIHQTTSPMANNQQHKSSSTLRCSYYPLSLLGIRETPAFAKNNCTYNVLHKSCDHATKINALPGIGRGKLCNLGSPFFQPFLLERFDSFRLSCYSAM